MTSEKTICNRQVSLLDIYPTLNSLCGLSEQPELEGSNLTPLLKNPKMQWEKPAITTCLRNNHAVRSQRYRYIHYADGTEELYDHKTDMNEWNNLAHDKKYSSVIQEHKRWLPGKNAPQVDDMKKPF